MNSVNEVWKTVDDYPNYMVSNFGNVKNQRGHLLNQQVSNMGYMLVHLSKNGKVKWRSVHRLVALAFIPNPDKLPIINHKDENPKNNKVDNLEWCTRSYNERYNNKPQRMMNTKRKRGIPLLPQSAVDGHIKALSKSVICIETGERFKSATSAARSLGLTKDCVAHAIKYNRRSGGYHWRWAND